MSLVLGAMRSQRIIALPMYKRLKFHPDSLMLSKPVVDQMMIYYHFNLTSPDELAKNKQSGMLNRLTTKAADTWAGFGKAPKGSWKVCETSVRRHIANNSKVATSVRIWRASCGPDGLRGAGTQGC